MEPQEEMRAQLVRAMALVTAIGLDLACLLVFGVLAGRYVDDRLHSSPWGLLLGLLIGIVGGGYTAYRMVMRVVR